MYFKVVYKTFVTEVYIIYYIVTIHNMYIFEDICLDENKQGQNIILYIEKLLLLSCRCMDSVVFIKMAY